MGFSEKDNYVQNFWKKCESQVYKVLSEVEEKSYTPLFTFYQLLINVSLTAIVDKYVSFVDSFFSSEYSRYFLRIRLWKVHFQSSQYHA